MNLFAKAAIKFIIICLLWQQLELKYYGCIQPREVDDIIGLILFYFILKGEK